MDAGFLSVVENGQYFMTKDTGDRYVAALWLSQRFTEQIGRNTRKFHRNNSLHVDVQRHFLWNKRQ